MSWSRALGHTGRLAALAGAAVLLSTASAAVAQERVLACRLSQYFWDPSGPPSLNVNRVWSILSLANLNAARPIEVHRIVFWDRNGNKLCDFSASNALPVKAFDPPVPFDFTRPLGAYQILNVSTTLLACVPWPVVQPDNIMGTMTVFVYWSFARGTGVPLNGAVVTFVQEIQSTLISSRNASPCEEIWTH